MPRIEYVTNHETQAVKVKRGPFGFIKVFLAWFFLAGIINVTIGLITTSWVRDCMRRNPQEINQQVCWATYRLVDGATDLAGLLVAGVIVSKKLAKDSKNRYKELEREKKS
jgi:hypothetical protein